MNKNEILQSIKAYAEKELLPKPFIPGKSQVPVSGAVLFPEDIEELADTVLDFWYTDWKKCAEFKRRLCAVTSKKYCVLVNSGSSASLIAQTALYKRNESKFVVTTALGFPTTVYPIWQNEKIPVFLDVDPKTLSPDFDYEKLYRKIGDASDRIIALFLFAHALGFPFHEGHLPAGRDNIVDCCDALGAKANYFRDNSSFESWQHVGIFSDAMTLSFFPAHQITAGEGGAILTDDVELAAYMEKLVNWGRDCYCLPGQQNTCGKRFSQDFPTLPKGWDHKYTFTELGYNLKMTEFQAALGMSQLTHLDKFVIARNVNFQYLLDNIQRHANFLCSVEVPEWSHPSPFGFPIFVQKNKYFNASELIDYLEKHKISTRRFFGGNLTRQPFIKDLSYISLDLTNTDYIMENGFWIGCWPGLTKQHMDYMIEILDQFFKDKGIQ